MDKNLCGFSIFPTSPHYEKARQIFNRSIQKYPSVITYCTDEHSVVQGICASRCEGLSLRIRSGGHNYEGFCLGDRAAVIDTGCMDYAELDEEKKTVTVGPGTLNRSLYDLLGAYGYPFPSGTCPTVAVAGLTLGGGWGLSARMFGLTCDSLLSAELTDACGIRHFASENHEKELFFALRGGGGGNFGVVTNLTFKLPPKLFEVTYVEMEAGGATAETAVEFILRVQRWLQQGDRRFTPLARIFHTPKEPRGLILFGIYFGSKTQAQASLSSFEGLGLSMTFEEMSFLKAINIVEDGYPPYEFFTTGGRFVFQPYSEEEAYQIVSLTEFLAEDSVSGSVSLYGLGGAVNDRLPRETAFFYRRALHIIALSTGWENPLAKCANLAWFSPRYQILKDLTYGSYVNFPNLENINYMQMYYGGNAERLSEVKARIDPQNVFCFPQSIV